MNMGHKISGGTATGFLASALMASSPAWAVCVHEAAPGGGAAGTSDQLLPFLGVLMTLSISVGFFLLIARGLVYVFSSFYKLVSQTFRKPLADSALNQEIKSLGLKTNKAIEALELEYEARLIEALDKNKTDQYTLTSV